MADMTSHDSAPTPRDHVYEVLKGLRAVMVCTADGDSTLEHARMRPMAVADLAEDGSLWFLTRIDGANVHDAIGDSCVRMVGRTKDRHAVLSGRFELSHDRSKIDEVWSKAAELAFPEGRDDPGVAVLVFRPIDAEIWDLAGINGLKFSFDATTPSVTGAALPAHQAL